VDRQNASGVDGSIVVALGVLAHRAVGGKHAPVHNAPFMFVSIA
jgi:hypothetical protein